LTNPTTATVKIKQERGEVHHQALEKGRGELRDLDEAATHRDLFVVEIRRSGSNATTPISLDSAAAAPTIEREHGRKVDH
jgi:hypothetical protein